MRKFSLLNENINNVDIGYKNLNSELVFITENGKQVGSAVVIYNDSEKAGIFSVSVLDSFKGKGYGKRLVKASINKCKERGFKILELNTEVDNVIANNLYKSLGFVQDSIFEGYNHYYLDLSKI